MTTNLTDEAIDNMRATMAASSALGAIAAAIWERASDPAAHEALIAELNAELMDLVNDDSEANEWYPQDYLQQQAIMELVAKAMIAQHLFTETITRCSCLAPFVDEPIAEPPAIKWFAALRPQSKWLTALKPRPK